MNIKRTIAAILAFLALASFAGCKGKERDNSTLTLTETAKAEASEEKSVTETETGSETEKDLRTTAIPMKHIHMKPLPSMMSSGIPQV